MTRTRIALIVLLLIAGGYFAYQRFQAIEEERLAEVNRLEMEARAARYRKAMEARAAAERNFKEQQKLAYENLASRPHLDMPMRENPRAYPRRPSVWRAGEKTFYENLLSKGRFDVLVVPFQVQDYAFARTIRSLMTAELALTIGALGKRVPDPYLVARALGDGERSINADDVYRLADKLGATRVVRAYVGHSRDNAMRLTVQIQDRSAGVLNAQSHIDFKHFENIPFSDEDPPTEAFQRMLPEVLGFLGNESPAPVPTGKTSQAGALEFSLSPSGMQSGVPEPARDAWYLQLLAALTPENQDRVRERFNEKSMLAVLSMSPASPEYRVLKARAFMRMGLRPAALKVLGTPVSIEEKHLFALLNGNLPDIESDVPQIRTGIRALLARLELNEIATAYGVRTRKKSLDEARALKLPGEVWGFLATRAFTDWDTWSQYENIQVKRLLDREFPIPGYTAEGIIQGAVSLGDIRKVQAFMQLSVLDHVRKFSDAQATSLCCSPLSARVTDLDYLDFLEAMGTDNLVRRAHLLAWTQGNPNGALEFISGIESAYKDYPQLALERAKAESELAQQADGTAKDGLSKSAYGHACDALYWEQGQTRTAAEALQLASDLNRREYAYIDNYYSGDFPFRPFYPVREALAEGSVANDKAALRNSAFDFGPVLHLRWLLGELQNKWDEFDEILKSVDGRFAGNSQRTLELAKSSTRKGESQAAEKYYREGIKAQPTYWQTYHDLGQLLVEKGDVARAGRLFSEYPGFRKGSGINAVELSNDAFAAGSLFYWSGNFQQAVPLYRIAADLNTGSNASIAGAIRLSSMNGDYVTAMLGSRERATRYNSQYGYSDYLGLLHAMGHSKEAWEVFTVLVGQLDEPAIWETALVGHRLAGTSESEISAWVAQDSLRNAGRMYGYASTYLLRAGVTDRMPSADLANSIAAIERPVWKVADGHDHVVRPSVDGRVQFVLGREARFDGVLPLGVFDGSQKVRVKSDLVYFAEAYRAMRAGDYKGAKAMLDEASQLYDLQKVSLGYLLPYYAFAAAKAGDMAPVAALLAKFPIDSQRFDYQLARAVVAGIDGKTDESLQALKLARYRRPSTELRPIFTEYELAEICEWLYHATRNVKYRDVALNWAKKVEVFSPWNAWPYAMEAKLSANGSGRRRAIAMAYYLDRNSERLSTIPKKEINAAVREFAGRNPFLNLKPRNSARDGSV